MKNEKVNDDKIKETEKEKKKRLKAEKKIQDELNKLSGEKKRVYLKDLNHKNRRKQMRRMKKEKEKEEEDRLKRVRLYIVPRKRKYLDKGSKKTKRVMARKSRRTNRGR